MDLLNSGTVGRTSAKISSETVCEYRRPPDTVVSPPRLLTLFLARKAITPAPSDVLLRRTIVEELGGFENSFPGIYEDQVFFAKVCLKVPVFVSGECWDRHRQHRDSACSIWRRTGEYYSAEASLRFLSWIENYLSGRGPKYTEVWTVLQKAVFPYRHSIVYRIVRHVEGWPGEVKGMADGIPGAPCRPRLTAGWVLG